MDKQATYLQDSPGGVLNLMSLRGAPGDYYLYCQDWPGRIFIELRSGAFLIADGPDGQPRLERVEPYRRKSEPTTLPKRRWWQRLMEG